MDTRLLLALATGVGIAAACGLRAFLPLLVVGLAARVGLLHLRPEVAWLAGDPALWALGAAAVLEMAGDKFPVVDHALDALGTVVRPAAAWVATYAVLQGWGTPWAQLVALMMSAGALAVHGVKAKTRLGSTAATLGHANPLLSVLEDVLSAVLVLLGVLLPLLALALGVALVWAVVRRRRRARR